MPSEKKKTSRAEDVYLSHRMRVAETVFFFSSWNNKTYYKTLARHLSFQHHDPARSLAHGDLEEDAKFNISPSEYRVFTRCYYETVIC